MLDLTFQCVQLLLSLLAKDCLSLCGPKETKAVSIFMLNSFLDYCVHQCPSLFMLDNLSLHTIIATSIHV